MGEILIQLKYFTLKLEIRLDGTFSTRHTTSTDVSTRITIYYDRPFLKIRRRIIR